MNTYSRTLSLPGVVRPVREHGSSALDRTAVAWSAPDPIARVTEAWGSPHGAAVLLAAWAPWPAPDPVMRFDLPAPLGLVSPRVELVEPTHSVPLPDLLSASRQAVRGLESPTPGALRVDPIEFARPGLPAPTLADAAPVATLQHDRSGISARLAIGLAAAAAAISLGAVAILSIL